MVRVRSHRHCNGGERVTANEGAMGGEFAATEMEEEDECGGADEGGRGGLYTLE